MLRKIISCFIIAVLILNFFFIFPVQESEANPILGFPKCEIDIYGKDILNTNPPTGKSGGYGMLVIRCAVSSDDDFTGFLIVRFPRYARPALLIDGEVTAYAEKYKTKLGGGFAETAKIQVLAGECDHVELLDSLEVLSETEDTGGKWYIFSLDTYKDGDEYGCYYSVQIPVKFIQQFDHDEFGAAILPYNPGSIEDWRYFVQLETIKWGLNKYWELFKDKVISGFVPRPWSLILSTPDMVDLIFWATGKSAFEGKKGIQVASPNYWNYIKDNGASVYDEPPGNICVKVFKNPKKFVSDYEKVLIDGFYLELESTKTNFNNGDTFYIKTLTTDIFLKWSGTYYFRYTIFLPPGLELSPDSSKVKENTAPTSSHSSTCFISSESWKVVAQESGSIDDYHVYVKYYCAKTSVYLDDVGICLLPITGNMWTSIPKLDFHISVTADKNIYNTGDLTEVEINIENCNINPISFVLGVSYRDPLGEVDKYNSQIILSPGSATLNPGESKIFTALWKIPITAPSGIYDIAVNCWTDNSYTVKYNDDFEIWAEIFTINQEYPGDPSGVIKITDNTKSDSGAVLIKGDSGTYYMVYQIRTGGVSSLDIYLTRSSDLINWDTPIKITTYGDRDANPYIAEADNGDLLVTYGSTMGYPWGWKTYLTRSTDGGDSWSTPVLIEPYCSGNPCILKASDGTLYLSMHRLSGTSKTKVRRSTDNGYTWTLVETISNHPYVLHSVMREYDGDLYMICDSAQDVNPDSNYNLYFYKSTDDGDTWVEQYDLTSSYIDGAPTFVRTDEGEFIVVWRSNNRGSSGSRDFYYITSDDFINWDSPQVLMEDSSFNYGSAELFKDTDGEIYITWSDDSDGDWEIFYTKLSNLFPSLDQISIGVHSPVDLHLFDPLGRHVGVNFSTNNIDLEIPGSSYSGPDSDPEIITILDPLQGPYTLILIAEDTGEYSLSIEGILDGVIIIDEYWDGYIEFGEYDVFNLFTSSIIDSELVNIEWPLIDANIEVKPANINFNSNGNFTVFITLPEIYDIDDINYSTIRIGDIEPINGSVANSKYILKFDRQDFDFIGSEEEEIITLTGQLLNDLIFMGSDVITVIT